MQTMIKAKKKTCIDCEKLTYIFSHKRCLDCSRKEKAKDEEAKPKDKPKTVKRPPKPFIKRSALKKKFPKPTGEGELFKAMWEILPHVCQVTGEALTEDNVNFSHILPKGRYPDYRLNPNNIWLVTWQVHHQWEHGDRFDPIFNKKRELRSILKHRYHEDCDYHNFLRSGDDVKIYNKEGKFLAETFLLQSQANGKLFAVSDKLVIDISLYSEQFLILVNNIY